MTEPTPAAIAEKLDEVLRRLPAEKGKDAWDRAQVVATYLSIAATALVGVAALWFTDSYREAESLAREQAQEQSARTQDLQVLAQFIPYLTGDDPHEQRVAIEGIEEMGNASLAAFAARMYPSRGAVLGLNALLRAGRLNAHDQQVIRTARDSLVFLPVVREVSGTVRE